MPRIRENIVLIVWSEIEFTPQIAPHPILSKWMICFLSAYVKAQSPQAKYVGIVVEVIRWRKDESFGI